MAQKIQLQHSELPPVCPHCKATLSEMAWHKIRGGPAMIGYVAIVSCPRCKKALGAMAS
ncbi:MAG: hypothetical protein ACREMF_10670 [Gemmatimonadales bacterium]